MPITSLHKAHTRHQLPLSSLLVEPYIEKHLQRRLFGKPVIATQAAWFSKLFVAQSFGMAATVLPRNLKALLRLEHGSDCKWIDEPDAWRKFLTDFEDSIDKRVIDFTFLYGPHASSMYNFMGITDLKIEKATDLVLEERVDSLRYSQVTVEEALEWARDGAYLGMAIGSYLPHLAKAEMFFDDNMIAVIERAALNRQSPFPSSQEAEIELLGRLSYESYRKDPAIANEFALSEFVQRWRAEKYDEIRHLIDHSPTGSDQTQRVDTHITAVTSNEQVSEAIVKVANLDAVADYAKMGLPMNLAVQLGGLAAADPPIKLPLPFYLCLAYVSDHGTVAGPGEWYIDFGTLMAAFGAVSEIGGILGQTSDIEPPELLTAVLPLEILMPSKEEFWRVASQQADETMGTFLSPTESDLTGLLPLSVKTRYRNEGIDYPNDSEAIKRQRDRLLKFWDHAGLHSTNANGAFTLGMAIVRNRPDIFSGKHGVYVDEEPDPITGTYRNPQNETNIKVGSMYSRQEQIHLCRVWADLYRPEARPYFESIS